METEEVAAADVVSEFSQRLGDGRSRLLVGSALCEHRGFKLRGGEVLGVGQAEGNVVFQCADQRILCGREIDVEVVQMIVGRAVAQEAHCRGIALYFDASGFLLHLREQCRRASTNDGALLGFGDFVVCHRLLVGLVGAVVGGLRLGRKFFGRGSESLRGFVSAHHLHPFNLHFLVAGVWECVEFK